MTQLLASTLVALVALVSCRGRAHDANPPSPQLHDIAPVVVGADARRERSSDPAWPPGPGSLTHHLRDRAQGPVLLVEERDGIVARTGTGIKVRRLVDGAVSRAAYDARIGVVWFLLGNRLEAIDLAGPAEPPVAIVDNMPDILFVAGRGESVAHPSCDACVIVSAVPPEVGLTTEANASGGELQGQEWERFQRDSKIAASARPRLSDTAPTFLKRIGRREEQPERALPLEKNKWPLPSSARSQPRFLKWGGERITVQCQAGCGHGFRPAKLGWILLVSGRTCDCGEDRCWATCVLYDEMQKTYARPSQPQTFGRDAVPEKACRPTFDAAGGAYILDEHRVCTANSCIALKGRILGWVRQGWTTEWLPEDSSVCPE